MKPDIIQLLLCEYATQDFQGKFVVGGVYGSAIVFQDSQSANMGKLKVFCEVRPKSKTHELNIVVNLNKKSKLMDIKIEYENKEAPKDVERLVFNLDVPPNTQLSDGDIVNVDVISEKEVISNRNYYVYIGRSPTITPGTIKVHPIVPKHG